MSHNLADVPVSMNRLMSVFSPFLYSLELRSFQIVFKGLLLAGHIADVTVIALSLCIFFI